MSSDENDHDLILDDSLQLFENASLMDSGDSAIHLSLDDIASFTNTIVATDGSHARFEFHFRPKTFSRDLSTKSYFPKPNTKMCSQIY
jgi:DNA-binding ferritin-like protein (Dps family)